MKFFQAKRFSYFKEFHSDPRFEVVNSPEGLQRVENHLTSAKILAWDYETDGLKWFRGDKPCGVAFAAKEGETIKSYYVPFRHVTNLPQATPEQAHALQKRILGNPEKLVIAHNAKFDLHMAHADGLEVAGTLWDTIIMATLYQEDQPRGLKDRAVKDLGDKSADANAKTLGVEVAQMAARRGMTKQEYMEEFGYSEVDVYLCGTYAAQDANLTLRLFDFYMGKGLYDLFGKSPLGPSYPSIWETEMGLLRVVTRMEEVGIPIDRELLIRVHERQIQKKLDIEKHFFGETGLDRFNLGSDDQLRDVLLHHFELKLVDKTPPSRDKPNGDYKVDAHTLKNFVGECPQLNHIIKWKEADHIVSSGTVSLLPYVDDNDVLHGEFNQYATNTGRFSSKNPNCQNIASYKGDLLDRVKPFFVVQRKEADPFRKQLIARGYSGKTKRVYVDFSQVELRILAHYSQDPKLLQTYREGGDIHDTVERAVFGTGKSVDPVTGDSIDGPNRRKSKTINFGINYGLTPEGFARRITEVTLEEARSFYQKHGEQFPGIEQLRVKLVNQMIADGGFFINMFGRRRQIPLILSRENWEQRRGARQAIGSLIQGTSADVTKISMWLTWKELRRRGLSSELVQTIHDENVTDCPEEEFEEVVRIKKQIMENFPCFSVPITVDADYSETNWDEKHTVRD